MRPKFTSLSYLDLSSTYFPLVVPRSQIDDQNDQQVAITGCRDLELIFFGLKDTLKELHLGNWVYDELLIYISQICKGVSVLEINSEFVSDAGVTQLFTKMEQLVSLDISACPKFLGVSFTDSQAHWAATKLRKLILGLEFLNATLMNSGKQLLHAKVPDLLVEVNAKKQFLTE